jgi:hypothetical protein
MVIIPTPASHASFVHVPSLADTHIHDVLDELDPGDTGEYSTVCLPVNPEAP